MQPKMESSCLPQVLFAILCSLTLAGCDGATRKSEQKRETEQSTQRRQAEIMEAVQRGAVLLSRSTIGDATIETYEIPRPYYVLGKPFLLEKDICVVYLKRGTPPVMTCSQGKSGGGG